MRKKLHFLIINGSFFAGDNKILQRIISSWGEMFSSSAIHTQTTALGEGVKQCTVGRSTIATITTRDWQVINYTLRMGKNSKKMLNLGKFRKFLYYKRINHIY